MYRVALVAALAMSLGACSLNTGQSPLASRTRMPAHRRSPDRSSLSAALAPALDHGLRPGLKDQQQRPARGPLARQGSQRNIREGAARRSRRSRLYRHGSQPERARDIINQYRHEKGLKPLRLNAELTAAAKEHSRDLAKWDRISHYGSDGSNPWDRVKRAGYRARLAAENVGTGQVSFDEVMRGWKESPGHNKNLLLGDAQEMGLALVQDPRRNSNPSGRW